MAKIRIHELAKDLNMKNKELLEKLNDMSVAVASHMSTLDEADADRIKAHILGKINRDVIEETRVQKTVIRRRRKVVKEEPIAAQTASDPVSAEAEETVDKATVAAPKAGRAEASAEEKSAKKDVAPASERAVKVVPEVKPKKKTASKRKVEAKTEPTEVEEPPAPEESDTPAVGISKEAEARAEPEPESPKPEKLKDAKVAKPAKARKKAKGEAPAKIIKLAKPERKAPVEPEGEKPGKQPERRAKVTRLPRPEKPVSETGVPEVASPEKSGKGRKRKRKPDEETTEGRLFKKKSSARKKTVVEGSDLYAKGTRGRKGRKGARGLGKGRIRASASDQKTLITTPKAIKRRIKIGDTIVLSDMGKRMGIKASDMIAKLMGMGVMVTVNQTIDFDTAILVAAEFEYELERADFEEEEVIIIQEDSPDDMASRPPVVTIMGHVDHGKTSLLDVIRETNVAEGEYGGITQHIGAYHVSLDRGQIVFLDTPGHEAFTAMRSRGASITDIVVLVVAADDGVMPQTLEAINHSRAAGVPIIVAVNKIDKENADIDRVQRELASEGLSPEEWGGDTIFVKVSAKEKQGIDELLEMILLQAEVLELKANPRALAQGHVVEAYLDSGRGPIATVLVQKGTLRAGNTVVCGIHYGKVRAMLDDLGDRIENAGPSIPVEIFGLSGVPSAGDELITLENERNAKQISMHRAQKQRSKELAQKSKISLESLFDRMAEADVKELSILLKADVQGSIEAISDALAKLSNEEVRIHILPSATGTITKSDLSLAAVSEAIIIGFNVRPSAKIQSLAEEEGVDIRFYSTIYDVVKDVKGAIVGMMASTYKETILGNAEVLEVFHIPRVGSIAGSKVTDGMIERSQMARLVRDGVVCYSGKIGSLRRVKDDVREVQHGYECGIGLENYNDIKQGDVIECYSVEEIKPVLE